MKKVYKQKVLIFFTLILSAVLLIACGSSDKGENKGKELKSADDVSSNSPYSKGLEKYYEELKEETDGEINIKHFPDGQIGDKNEIIEGVKIGTTEFGMVGSLPDAPATEAMSLPYLFEDSDHMHKVMDGEIGEKLIEQIEEDAGVKVVGYVYFAPRHLTTKKTKVETPEDLKGLKIRVPDNKISIETWEALGASPSPIAFTEVFSGLQQGVIDGQENPYDLIRSSSFYEVQDYLIETNHAMPLRWLIMNEKYYDSLSEDEQSLIENKWEEHALKIEEAYKDELEEDKQKLLDEGMELIEADEEAFMKATKDVWKDIAPEAFGEGVYEEIQDLR